MDWRGLLELALARGLRPAEVWALTPVEFALMTGRAAGPKPLTRDRLRDLEAAFPDAKGRTSDGGI